MTTSFSISDFPNEILHLILEEVVCHEGDIEISVDTDQNYLNRFTRSARVSRRVCRRWKDLIDQPSKYCSRMTTATLVLDIGLSLEQLSAKLAAFWARLGRSKSLIVLKLIGRWSMSGDASQDEAKRDRGLKVFAIEMSHLAHYTDRIIKIVVHSGEPTLSPYLVGFIGMFGNIPRLSTLDIFAGDLEADTFLFKATESSYSLTSPDVSITFKGICHSLPSLQSLSLNSFHQDQSRSLPTFTPPGLASLTLSVASINLVSLASCAAGIKDLSMEIPYDWDPDDEKLSTLTLDALITLRLGGNAQALMDMLRFLNCSRLEHLSLDVSYQEHPVTRQGDHIPVPLPHLRTLVNQGHFLPSLALLMAVDIPNTLEKFTINEVYGSFVEEDLLTDRAAQSLKRIRTKHLEVFSIASLGFLFFRLYSNVTTVQDLRVTVHDPPIGLEEHTGFEAPFTALRSLAITGEHLPFMSSMLHCICFGKELVKLDISLDCPSYRSSEHNASHWKFWLSFVSEASSGGKFSTVTTLITKWSSESIEFIQTLFDLAPRARTLILRDVTYDEDDGGHWPLSVLDPTHLVNQKKGITVPSVKCVILEYKEDAFWPIDINALDHVRPKFEEKLPDLLASRLRAGADPIQKVILKSFSKWDVPEIRDFPQECGMVLRLEAMDDGTFHK